MQVTFTCHCAICLQYVK